MTYVAVLTFALASGSCAGANQRVTAASQATHNVSRDYNTRLHCGGVDSTIISTCGASVPHFCSSQRWIVGRKVIALVQNHFEAFKWACLPSRTGDKVILDFGNFGNCDECEGFEIWNIDGSQSSGLLKGHEFDPMYKRQGFPANTGTKFWEKFNHIHRPLSIYEN
jgi:hypothetical protein